MTITFKEGFLWGAASSAPQMEGASRIDGKGENIWDYWFDKSPEKFYDGIGSVNTSQFYVNYKEDIKMMKQLGINSFRTSISWSRLLPEGRGEPNKSAVEFYNNVVDEMLQKGIEPIMNLFHFDMPIAMQKIGGWENREVVEAYVRYAKLCFQLFGDKVKRWITFNEPIVHVEGGYLYGFHYPLIRDMKRAVQVAYHSVIASALAVDEYHKLEQGGTIGIVLNLTPSYPRDSSKEEDVRAARIVDLLFNRSFLDTVVYGSFPKELVELIETNNLMPPVIKGDEKIIQQGIVDFLGVNYYQPRRVRARETRLEGPIMPESFFEPYVWPEARMNTSRGWEIYEQGIYDIAKNIQENYKNIPWFISENGMGVEGEEAFQDENGMVLDDYRIQFITQHLERLAAAIDEGANCFGYHTWTFLDNWSWTNAYKNRYGLVRLELPEGIRKPKKSFYWFQQLCKTGKLIVDEDDAK